MNVISKFFAVVTLCTLFSCKKVKNEQMVVIRNCTGTYLRFEGKDYKVCNDEKLSSYPDNAAVKATFKKTKDCSIDRAICLMAYPYESWVNLEKVE